MGRWPFKIFSCGCLRKVRSGDGRMQDHSHKFSSGSEHSLARGWEDLGSEGRPPAFQGQWRGDAWDGTGRGEGVLSFGVLGRGRGATECVAWVSVETRCPRCAAVRIRSRSGLVCAPGPGGRRGGGRRLVGTGRVGAAPFPDRSTRELLRREAAKGLYTLALLATGLCGVVGSR